MESAPVPISDFLKTFCMVLMKIFKSSNNDILSTYQISYSNLLLNSNKFRPLTCAHPVMPGRTSWRRRCVSLYNGRYCTNKGLGPIKLISPFITFKSCGTSSSEVDRTNFPTLVNRCASGRRFPEVSFSSVIVLNLTTLNIRSFFPGRSCMKKAPAPLLAITRQSHVNKKTGQMTINPNSEKIMSKKRLKYKLYITKYLRASLW